MGALCLGRRGLQRGAVAPLGSKIAAITLRRRMVTLYARLCTLFGARRPGICPPARRPASPPHVQRGPALLQVGFPTGRSASSWAGLVLRQPPLPLAVQPLSTACRTRASQRAVTWRLTPEALRRLKNVAYSASSGNDTSATTGRSTAACKSRRRPRI